MNDCDPDRGSVSLWLHLLKDGDPRGVQRIWERYFDRLVQLGLYTLRQKSLRHTDAEDIAISGFAQFCAAVSQGRYPQLNDRDGLWKLLVRITVNKARDAIRADGRQKRGGGRVLDEAAFEGLCGVDGEGEQVMGMVVSDEPTPEFSVLVAEQVQHLLAPLDESSRAIALAKLEGYTNAEIARSRGCSISTIERTLNMIRKTWAKEDGK